MGARSAAAEAGRKLQRNGVRGCFSRRELYFVHSYEAKPAYDAHRLADTVYGGRRLCAAAQKGSVIGCQFHPEKSGKLGLSVIHRYLILCEAAH